jgi:hypothetical protein
VCEIEDDLLKLDWVSVNGQRRFGEIELDLDTMFAGV